MRIGQALSRVPVMTRSQLARLLQVTPTRIGRILDRYPYEFDAQPYDGSLHHATRYGTHINGTLYLIRMRPYGYTRFDPTGQKRKSLRTETIARILAVGEFYVALRSDPKSEWDVRVHAVMHESVHATVTYQDETKPQIGLYFLAHQGPLWKGKSSVLRGIVHRTIQNVQIPHLVFVCPAAHYGRAVHLLLKMEYGAGHLHVLPWESLMAQPHLFLHAVADHDLDVEWYLRDCPPRQRLSLPVSHNGYGALIEDASGHYRLLDCWNGGSIRQMRAWIEDSDERVCFIPGEPMHVASRWMHVRDATMRQAFTQEAGGMRLLP